MVLCILLSSAEDVSCKQTQSRADMYAGYLFLCYSLVIDDLICIPYTSTVCCFLQYSFVVDKFALQRFRASLHMKHEKCSY